MAYLAEAAGSPAEAVDIAVVVAVHFGSLGFVVELAAGCYPAYQIPALVLSP
ncbi:TMhelix containing protein [Vibrio phage 1.276.O._10N.286.54.E4]|nr:TMhelix containing protein [Vibrio phage 1.276.O._10N.286.54.E4]